MAICHNEMVDAVNEAEDVAEHLHALAMLAGWRECADFLGYGWGIVEASRHTKSKYGEGRKVLRGVLMDWEQKD